MPPALTGPGTDSREKGLSWFFLAGSPGTANAAPNARLLGQRNFVSYNPPPNKPVNPLFRTAGRPRENPRGEPARG